MVANISNVAVVDASYILSFLLPDEKRKEVEQTFDQFDQGTLQLISTQLLPFEVINGLRSAVVQKRLGNKNALSIASLFLSLEITYMPVQFAEVLQTALLHNLTVYDAGYLVLAREQRADLLTFDSSLVTFYPSRG